MLLAPLVGPLADAWRKGRVMALTNGVKALGCGLLIAGVDPLLAFAVVGLGAAAYSPAKYGLVTELLPPQRLVAANGWIEVASVGAILLGTVLGGLLVSPLARSTGAWAPPLDALAATRLLPGLAAVLGLYGLAALLNAGIPDSGARYPRQRPATLLRDFLRDNRVLWGDASGRIALAVTTLFWGIGATLQFIVLRWAGQALGLGLHEAAGLQAATAVGVIVGAVAAARWVRLQGATAVLPLGVALGLLVPGMTAVDSLAAAVPLLVLVGACAGFFVVPMNALLQHRGHRLLSAGRSIAVQNFNENVGVLALLALYALLTAADWPLDALIWGFGALVALLMAGIGAAHRRGMRAAPIHPLQESP